MHSFGKKFLLLTNQLGKILENFRNYFLSPQLVGIENIFLFGFLLKVFYSLTNQLGTFFSKRRNYFLSSQVVGIEKCQN